MKAFNLRWVVAILIIGSLRTVFNSFFPKIQDKLVISVSNTPTGLYLKIGRLKLHGLLLRPFEKNRRR